MKNNEPTTKDFFTVQEDDKPDHEEIEEYDNYEDEMLHAQEVCEVTIGNVTVF